MRTASDLDALAAKHRVDGWPFPVDALTGPLERRLAGDRAAIRQERRAHRELFGTLPHWDRNIRHLCERHGLDRAGLLAMVRERDAAGREFERQWHEAAKRLFVEAAREPQTMRLRGRNAPESSITDIPALVFMEHAISAHFHDRIAADANASMADWARVRQTPALSWSDVKVHRGDLLRAFPPGRPTAHDATALAAKMKSRQETGPRMKRDSALLWLREETKCTARDALAAWTALPSDLRGARG